MATLSPHGTAGDNPVVLTNRAQPGVRGLTLTSAALFALGVGLGPRMMFEHGRRRGLPHRLPRHACRVVIGHFLATRRRHEGVGPRVHLALPVVLIGIGVLILVEGRRLRTLGTSVRTSAMRVRLLASLNHPGSGTHLVSGSRCTKWWPPSRREPGLRGS